MERLHLDEYVSPNKSSGHGSRTCEANLKRNVSYKKCGLKCFQCAVCSVYTNTSCWLNIETFLLPCFKMTVTANREHEAVEADCIFLLTFQHEPGIPALALPCSQSSIQSNTGDLTIGTVTVSLKNLDTSQSNTCITAESPRPDCNECWIFINLVYYCNITKQSARRAHSYDWPFCQIMLSPRR